MTQKNKEDNTSSAVSKAKKAEKQQAEARASARKKSTKSGKTQTKTSQSKPLQEPVHEEKNVVVEKKETVEESYENQPATIQEKRNYGWLGIAAAGAIAGIIACTAYGPIRDYVVGFMAEDDIENVSTHSASPANAGSDISDTVRQAENNEGIAIVASGNEKDKPEDPQENYNKILSAFNASIGDLRDQLQEQLQEQNKEINVNYTKIQSELNDMKTGLKEAKKEFSQYQSVSQEKLKELDEKIKEADDLEKQVAIARTQVPTARLRGQAIPATAYDGETSNIEPQEVKGKEGLNKEFLEIMARETDPQKKKAMMRMAESFSELQAKNNTREQQIYDANQRDHLEAFLGTDRFPMDYDANDKFKAAWDNVYAVTKKDGSVQLYKDGVVSSGTGKLGATVSYLGWLGADKTRNWFVLGDIVGLVGAGLEALSFAPDDGVTGTDALVRGEKSMNPMTNSAPETKYQKSIELDDKSKAAAQVGGAALRGYLVYETFTNGGGSSSGSSGGSSESGVGGSMSGGAHIK